MKYYWAKWKDKPWGPNPFVILVDNGHVFRVGGSDNYTSYCAGPKEMQKEGLIIGPEIPVPPEEWENSK